MKKYLPVIFLTLFFANCKKENTVLPIAAFSFDYLDNGEVQYLNRSQESTSYQWDFGDGTTSTKENPVHIYAKNGTYEVMLMAFNNGESTTASRTLSITNIPLGTWESKLMSFPGPSRSLHFSFTLNNKLYFGGGYGDSNSPLKDFWVFDLDTKKWSELPELPDRLGYGQCQIVKGRAYLGFATEFGSVHEDFYVLEEEKGIWIHDYDGSGSLRRGTNAPAFSFVIGDIIYYGYESYETTTNGMRFIAYDPINKVITDKANYPALDSWFVTTFANDTNGYAGTGAFRNGPNDFFPFADFYKYNPQTDVWSNIGNFPGGARYQSISFESNGTFYLGMGQKDRTKIYNDLWAFDLSQDSWQLVSEIPSGIGDFVEGQPAGLLFPFVIQYPDEFWLGGGFFDSPGRRIGFNKHFYQFKLK